MRKKSIILILLIILFVLFVMLMGANPLYMLSMLVLSIILMETSSKIHEHFALFFFGISFFFFLMGAELMHVLFGLELNRGATLDAENHYYLVILISLVSLAVGYQIRFTKNVIETRDGEKYYSTNKVLSVRKVAKTVFYFSYVLYLLPVIEKIVYVRSYSYYSSYVEYASKLPLIVVKLGDICPVAFSIFLATFPKKKECKGVVILYLFYAGLMFLTGKRYYTVAAVILVITYYLIRNRFNTGTEKWISKKMILLLVACVPFACVGLYIYSFVRTGSLAYSSMSFSELFFKFFEAVGDSDRVIKYGYMYKELIPDGRIYSFGSLIDYFRCGFLAKLITGTQLSVSQTVEYALEGNSFSHILSYLYFPSKYLAGRGLGSSYVAELFQDGGYLWVVLGNLIIGIILRNGFTMKRDNVWKNALMFYVYSFVMRLPRDSFDAYIVEIIGLKFIIYFVGIFVLANVFSVKMSSKWTRCDDE